MKCKFLKETSKNFKFHSYFLDRFFFYKNTNLFEILDKKIT